MGQTSSEAVCGELPDAFQRGAPGQMGLHGAGRKPVGFDGANGSVALRNTSGHKRSQSVLQW